MSDEIPIADLVRRQHAILASGQLMGIAMQLDWRELEAFLESAPADFRYDDQVRAAVQYARAIQGEHEPHWLAEIKYAGQLQFGIRGTSRDEICEAIRGWEKGVA